ncbi:hypothetical protein CVV67_16480 [Arthrobacter stackebrandtii]|nr:hypothetical protein CVV67_16480 [Arthrobacter stackebrandtii]
MVPMMRLAKDAGLHSLPDEWLSVPTDNDPDAGLKAATLADCIVAGADSIRDIAVLCHGAMKQVFTGCLPRQRLGVFLRFFTFGHVRQLDADVSRLLINLARKAPLFGAPSGESFVFAEVDDTISEVHGYQMQGSGCGYSGIRGLNNVLDTASRE